MGIDSLFYNTNLPWFDWTANLSILAIIALVLALFAWILYDVITGPSRRRSDENRMRKGLELGWTMTNMKPVPAQAQEQAAAPDPPQRRLSPFAPGTRKQVKQPAKHNA